MADRWEYKIESVTSTNNSDLPKQEQLLNQVGEEGWELVSVFLPYPNDTSPRVWTYFKRLKT